MKRPKLDYDEHTSEEERKALAKFPYKAKTKAAAATAVAPVDDDDFLTALLADAERNMEPIHVRDPFTHWIRRVLAETVFAECRVPSDPARDTPAVLAEKQLYAAAVLGSQSFKPPCGVSPLLEAQGSKLLALVAD